MQRYRKALIIFAKRPNPGTVKTRLVPPLTCEGAAELYRRMLHDILSKTGACEGLELFLFYEDGPGAAAYFAGIGFDLRCVQQKGLDLGERMSEAFRHVFAKGYDSVAIIGTDSPDLPLVYIQKSYEHLQECGRGAVFGPSEDGGYYLLAMNSHFTFLFDGVPWSSGQVLSKSIANAGTGGIPVKLLPQWYDIDCAEDLFRPGLLDLNNGAPLTRQYIAEWLKAGRSETTSALRRHSPACSCGR